MRDILFSLLVLGILPTCYRRPFIGLLTFSWLAYMRGQDLTWGFARNQRWSMLVGAVTVLGYGVTRPERWFRRDPRCFLLIGMMIWIAIGVALSERGVWTPYQIQKWIEFNKVVCVALFTTAIVTRPEQLRVLVWLIALSLGFYGFKGGLSGLLGGMHTEVLRGPGGMLSDNNDFGLALVMSIPMLLHIGLSEANKILRRGIMVVIPFTILTIVLTHSRGAFLALAGVFFVLIWRSRNRLAGFAVGALALVAVAIAAPASYYERIAMIADYEQDGSAMGRLAAWKTAINMGKAHPVMGVGLTMFRVNYTEYKSGEAHEGVRVAHNSYLQMWAEGGLPTLGMYLLMILLCIWSLWRVRGMAKRYYFTSWIINYATMFEATLVGFIIGSTFLNRSHFDLLYHLVAMVVVFEALAREEMASPMHHPTRPTQGGLLPGPMRYAGERGFRRLGRGPRDSRTRGFRNLPLPG
jgi:probable O-glycosylation ligase (exosortase A-associated)